MIKPEDLLEFIETRTFVEDWEDLGLSDDDLAALQITIMQGGKNAPVVRASGGLRKLRFAPPSWNIGKRGAIRVGFAHFARHGIVLLTVAYGKNEKSNLSTVEKQGIKQYLERFQAALDRQRGIGGEQ